MRLKHTFNFLNDVASDRRRYLLDRRFLAIIICVALLSFLIRMGLLWGTGFAQRPFFDDEGKYHEMASSIASGEGFMLDGRATSWSGPGFPAYIAFWYLLFGSKLFVGRIANILLGAVLVALVCLVGSKIFNKKVGLMAGAIVAIYPSLVYWNLFMLTEIFYACGILATTLVFFLLYEKPSINRAILAGFFLGAVSYIRPIGLIMIPLIFLWVLIFFNTRFLKRVILIFVIFVSLILVLTPWTIRNYKVHHRFILMNTNSGVNFLQGNNPISWAPDNELRGNLTYYGSESLRPYFQEAHQGLSEIELNDRAMAITKQFLRDHVSEAPIMMFFKLKQFFKIFPYGASFLEKLSLAASYGILLPFMIAGFLVAIFKNKKTWIFHVFLIATMLSSIIFYGCPRLRLPFEPIMIILGCFGISWCWDKGTSLLNKKTEITNCKRIV